MPVELLHRVFRRVEHTGGQFLEPLVSVPIQGVPEHQRGQPVAGAGQGGIVDANVLYGAAHLFHVGLAGQDYAAGRGAPISLWPLTAMLLMPASNP